MNTEDTHKQIIDVLNGRGKRLPKKDNNKIEKK